MTLSVGSPGAIERHDDTWHDILWLTDRSIWKPANKGKVGLQCLLAAVSGLARWIALCLQSTLNMKLVIQAYLA